MGSGPEIPFSWSGGRAPPAGCRLPGVDRRGRAYWPTGAWSSKPCWPTVRRCFALEAHETMTDEMLLATAQWLPQFIDGR